MQFGESIALDARGAIRVEARRLDVNDDGEQAGYYIDVNPDIIRLGPPGIYPFEPDYEGFVTYRFEAKAGEYELRLEYVDDKDDPVDTKARIRVSVNGQQVGEIGLDANDDAVHAWTHTLRLRTGDRIGLHGRSDRTGNDFCRIDRMWLVPTRGGM